MDQIFQLATRKIIRGDSFEFMKIIRAHPEVVAESFNGETFLHIACDNGMTEIVEILLNSGCDLNRLNDEGESPLHLAIYRGFKQIVSLLLKQKADPLLKNLQGKDSFAYAKEFNEVEILEMLDKCKELITDDWYYSPSSEISVTLSPVTPVYIDFNSFENHPVLNFEVFHTEISTYHSTALVNLNVNKNNSQHLNTENNFSIEDVLDFLEALKLRKYFKRFVDHGFDCFDSLLLQMKTPLKIDSNVLRLVGVDDEKDRKIIVDNLKKQSEHSFLQRSHQSLFLLLEDIKLEQYYLKFADSNLVQLDQLILQAKNNMKSLEDQLEKSLKIVKYGHRVRIIGLLQAQEIPSNTRCMLL